MQFFRRLIKTKRFWTFIGLVVVYTVFGFFVAPKIIHSQIVGGIDENLGRTATVETVRFNPYVLSLTIRGFELKDADGEVFVAFDELYVNFQTSSLFRWAYTFKELRLDNPRIHARLMEDERPNFADIIDRADEAAEERPAKEEPPAVPRVIVSLLQINGAVLRATNLAAPEPEAVAFTPADFELVDFTTIPERDGQYTLGATGHGGGRWEWSGVLTFLPLRSAGTFELSGMQLPALWDVAKNRVNFEITSGELGMRVDYAVERHGDTLHATVSDASLALDDFKLREKGKEPDLFTLDSLRVSGVRMQYPQQEVSVGRVALTGADITAWLTEDGEVNWLSVFPPPDSAAVPADSAAAAPAAPLWRAGIDEFALEDFALHFEDRTTDPDFAIDIDPLNVVVRDIHSDPGAMFDVGVDMTIADTGKLHVEGTVAAQPPQADVAITLEVLPLPIFQPYVDPVAKVDVISGSFGVSGNASYKEGETPDKPDIRFEGRVVSNDFEAKDKANRERFLAWQAVEVNGINYDSKSVQVDEVVAKAPFAKVMIHEDRTTNLQDVMVAQGDTTAAPADTSAAAPPPLPISVGLVRVEGGSADFSDFSLVLPFAAGIESLNGEIKGLSSDPASRADVTLDGVVEPDGEALVRGQINPLSGDLYTNVDVIFKDFDLPVLTPYSGHFIGREIDKGKLMLDLNYQVEERWLIGENKIVLDQLELGDDIDSPEATSMPVGLGVALLKDRNGKIDLDVPVEGDLDDPKFSIWDAVWDVIINTFTKVITAPFKLLGSLVGFGGDGDELSHADYTPGQAELTAEEQEKVLKLAEALNERPQLQLDVRGSIDPEADTAAIRASKYAAFIGERTAQDPKKYTPPEGADYSAKLLEDLYKEFYGKDAMKALEEQCQVPELDKEGNAKKDKTVLDEAAFYAEIQRILTERQPVSEEELKSLGVDRSRYVKDLLVTTGQIVDTRIFILDVDTEGEAQDGQVRVEMKLSD